jgi:hypothetical protein
MLLLDLTQGLDQFEHAAVQHRQQLAAPDRPATAAVALLLLLWRPRRLEG